MLNASVKELENQVFTFHSIVAPAEKTADLTAVSDDNSYVARYINSKNKKSFLIPIRGLLNLGIVQMGTTKVKALDPKAEVAKVNDYLLEKSTDGKESSNVFLCSFCQR
jgi:hypothetical protein